MSATISEYIRKLGTDVDGAVARFGGNIELYEKFVLRFTEDENFPKLKHAISESNKEEILFYAHTLKGVTGNFGFVRLYEISSDIVAKYRADDMESVRNLFPQLETAYEELIGVINDYKENFA